MSARKEILISKAYHQLTHILSLKKYGVLNFSRNTSSEFSFKLLRNMEMYAASVNLVFSAFIAKFFKDD